MARVVFLFFLSAFLYAGAVSAWPVTVGSWNTMLQPWFLWEEDVLEILPVHFDVLALQEVWTESARDKILAKTAHAYPHHYWPQAHNEQVGCDLNDPTIAYLASTYVGCLVAYGIDTQTVQQPLTPVPYDCLKVAIGLAIHNYDPRNQLCLACLINTLETLPQADAGNAVGICGAGNGPKYGHGGVNGQLILSKYPIEQVTETRFEGFVVNRVNVHATINGIKFGFGHFAFNLLEDAEPTLAPLMYGALQPDQVKDLVDAGVDVIVGDMNSGPNYQPAGYNKLFESGFHQVSTTSATWCDEARADFLPCKNAVSVPMSIDHIFVRNSSSIVSWQPKIFNEEPVASDHVGVSAKVYDCWWCLWL